MPGSAEWATVAVTEDLRHEAAQLADISKDLLTEAAHWKHPAWGERLRLAAGDVQLMAEGLLLIADEGDFWRMRGAIDRATEERCAAQLILLRARRNREVIFAPVGPDTVGLVP